MATTPRAGQLDSDAAAALAEVSSEDQRRMQLLRRLGIDHVLSDPNLSLLDLIKQIGQEAEARGMTPEILESILNER